MLWAKAVGIAAEVAVEVTVEVTVEIVVEVAVIDIHFTLCLSKIGKQSNTYHCT